MIYLDYAATVPMTDEAKKAYIETATEYFGNANSGHIAGQKAQSLLDYCRGQLSQLLALPATSLLFTSGGTESNHLALQLSLNYLPADKKQVLVSPLEHSSILNFFASQPEIELTILPLENGQVTIKSLASSWTERTGLVVVQQINSITGIIQNIEELSSYVREKGGLFHCDCVQGFGKFPLPKNVTSWSSASHKIGGPKGCGLLYLNPEISFTPIIKGTVHEQGFRAGTIDLPSIASFTTATYEAIQHQAAFARQVDELNQFILKKLPNWENFSTYTTYFGIIGLFSPKKFGDSIMEELSEQGICISTSSACHTGGMIDPALIALNFTTEKAQRFIRISFGKKTTLSEIEIFLSTLKKIETN